MGAKENGASPEPNEAVTGPTAFLLQILTYKQHRQLLGKRVTYKKLKEKTKKMLTLSHYKTPQIFSLKHNPVAETNSKACWHAKAKPPHLRFWAPSPSLLWDYTLIIAASLTEGHRTTRPIPKPASHCETPAASPPVPLP